MESAGTQDLASLAAEAFIYGFPLVFDLQQVERFTRTGMGSLPAGPLNVFAHAPDLAGPKDTFVSINNDTVYSIANVDLSAGPATLEVPDSRGRYYVLQFVDAWTNNFAYVGHRATGTGAGRFLLVPPDWSGQPPTDARVIRFPTTLATIAGRWAVDGTADMPAVRELQRALTLTATADGRGLPDPDPSVAEDLRFFEQLRVWIQAFPPARRDLAYQRRFEPLGVFADESLYGDGRSPLAKASEPGSSRAGRKWRRR